MNCDAVMKQLPLLIYGELPFDDEEALHQHLESCVGCHSEFARTAAFHQRMDDVEAEVDPMLLVNCRRNLRIATGALAERQKSSFTWSWFGKPVSALTLLAMGFFGGRMLPDSVSNLNEAGAVASRVRFVEPRDSGQVQIVLEETRQRTLSGGMDDESIRELLLRATRESSDPGVRVGTMDLLKTHSESEEVRLALLHALRHDTNAGVRLKALEALRSSAGQEDTRRALAEVLLKDDNPGVRTQAVDLLTQKDAPELVGVLQEIMTREENRYVRMKVQRALADMNASVETF